LNWFIINKFNQDKMMNKLLRPMANVAKITALQAVQRQNMVFNQTRMLHMLTNRATVTPVNMFQSQVKNFSAAYSPVGLYLSDVDKQATEHQVRAVFEQYGTLSKVIILNRNPEIPASAIVIF